MSAAGSRCPESIRGAVSWTSRSAGRASYCDLSLFQLVAGLRYAFPRAMAELEPRFLRVTALHARIAARPRTDAYLKSARRIAFNEDGIFRHYPELDGAS